MGAEMRRLIICLVIVCLSGCYGSGRRGGEQAPAIYDFGPPATRLAPAAAGDLAIEVRAPLWLDTAGIDYRLLYADSARLREYTRARWAGPPAVMIQQRLVQKLPLIPAGQGRTRCVLRIDIDEFSQVFDAPAASNGVLKGRFELLDRTRRTVAARDIAIVRGAPSPDARGGVAALTAAVDQLAEDILAWQAGPDARQMAACAG
jgi:ABC-type uncharacterized transport system auxiliary subunit